jgi:hypothetical protein
MAAIRWTRRFRSSDERVRDLSVHPLLGEGRLSTHLGRSLWSTRRAALCSKAGIQRCFNPRIDRRFSFCSVTGDKVEPAIYAANIENCGDCWVTVCLDRQHGAFHGIDRSWAGNIRRPALDVASAFARQIRR